MDQFGSLVSQCWWWHSHWLCCLWSLAKIQSLKWVSLLENFQRCLSQTDGSQCCTHIHINGVITMHYNREILSLTLWFKKQLWVLIIHRRSYKVYVLLCRWACRDGRLIPQLRNVFSVLTDWHLMSWNRFCITMEGSRVEGWEGRIWRPP